MTSVSAEKLRWLFTHPCFRRRPASTLCRVALWEWRRSLGRRSLIRLGQDFALTVRPHDGVGRLLFYFGRQADELFSFFGAVLEPGMVVVDVGANIGSLAIFCAGRVAPSGRVIALEADKETAALLLENAKLNRADNLDLHVVCVSDRSGPTEFFVNPDSAKSSIANMSGRRVTVEATSLDDLLLTRLERLDVLKIDVEGADYRVLRGAEEIIRRFCPRFIIIETLGDQDKICTFLRDHGYALRSYDPVARSLRPVETMPLNLIAVRADVRPLASATAPLDSTASVAG